MKKFTVNYWTTIKYNKIKLKEETKQTRNTILKGKLIRNIYVLEATMNEISSFTSLLFVELKRNLNSISLFDLISIVDRFFFWGEKYNDDDDEQLSLFDNSIDVKE